MIENDRKLMKIVIFHIFEHIHIWKSIRCLSKWIEIFAIICDFM